MTQKRNLHFLVASKSHMPKATWISLLLLFSTWTASAQKAFFNRFGITDSDYGNSVVATTDGGYALINQTQHLGNLLPQVIKTDCNGNLIWARAFRMDNICTGYDLASVNTNLVFLLSYRDETGNYLTAVTLLDYTGNIIWSKSLPLQTASLNGNLVVEQGGFVICGNPNNTPGTPPATALVRLDGNGDVTHAVRIHLQADCTPMGVARLNFGKYVVMGTYPSVGLPGFKDVSLILTDDDFTPQKAVVYDTYYDDEPADVLTDAENNVYVCGRSYFMVNNWDAFLLRLNPNFSPLSVSCYDAGTPQGEMFRNMTNPYAGNDLALCGDLGAFDERNPMIVKTQSNGQIIFSKQYVISPLFTNYFFSIAPTLDNGFAVTGDVRPPTAFRDAPLFKTTASGHDSCFAQDITLNVYTPAHSFTNVTTTWFPLSMVALDTLPLVENVPIHQVDVCNPQNPCPAFDYDAYTECPGFCFDFTDRSVGGDSWAWEFPGGTPATSTLQDPGHICYAVDGTYPVKLTVTNSVTGGTSVLEKNVTVFAGCNPVFPNIITPDGNGTNDEFTIAFLPLQYELKIFNRWGMLINEFSEPGKSWKGTNKDGTRVTQGVYYYTFINRVNGDEFKGFIQVAY